MQATKSWQSNSISAADVAQASVEGDSEGEASTSEIFWGVHRCHLNRLRARQSGPFVGRKDQSFAPDKEHVQGI